MNGPRATVERAARPPAAEVGRDAGGVVAPRPPAAATAARAHSPADATLLRALIETRTRSLAELTRRGRLPAFFLSDFSVANAYIFRHTYRYRVADLPDQPVLGVRRSGERFRLATPLVAYDAEAAPDVGAQTRDLPLYPIAAETAGSSTAAAHADRDQSDYVYRAGHLAALEGDHFKRIRRGIAQLYRRHDVVARPLGPEASAFVGAWADERGFGPDGADVAECREAIATTPLFGLDAVSYLVDGDIAGISLTDHALPNTSIVLFCKAARRLPYLTDAIFQRIAHALPPDRYLNLCQDLGLDGLRAKKTFLQPAAIADKYMLPATRSGT